MSHPARYDEDCIVCSNCGAETLPRDRAEADDRLVCAGFDGTHDAHDWSEPEPLPRLEARVDSSSYELSVRETSDRSGEWRWAEVTLEDRDETGASEAIQSIAATEGFSFVGVAGREDGDVVLTFNRDVGAQ